MPPQPVTLHIPTRTILKVLALTIGAWALLGVAKLIGSALLLLTIALFLAVALDPLVRRLQRLRMNRLWAVVALMTMLVLILAGIGALFAAPLASQSSKLASEAPHMKEDLLRHDTIRRANERTHALDRLSDEVQKLPEQAAGDAAKVLAVLAHGVIGAFTLVFLTAFLLIEGPQLTRGAQVLWPQLRERRWWSLLQSSYSTIGDYVGGTMLVALIDGIVIALLAFVLHVPFALPLAVWATLWGLLPIIGSVIGTAPAIVLALTVSPLAAIIVLVVSVLYHSVARAILHPAIVGRAIEMSAFFVFLAILMGESVLGMVGILLAVPAAAIIQLIVTDIIERRDSEAASEQPTTAADEVG
jgi:predicted PurR-regulated permease PerM